MTTNHLLLNQMVKRETPKKIQAILDRIFNGGAVKAVPPEVLPPPPPLPEVVAEVLPDDEPEPVKALRDPPPEVVA